MNRNFLIGGMLAMLAFVPTATSVDRPVGVGAQATTNCTDTRGEAEATADGIAPWTDAYSWASNQIFNREVDRTETLHSHSYSLTVGTGGGSSASASANSGLGGALGTASSQCNYTSRYTVRLNPELFNIFSSDATPSFGCTADAASGFSGTYDGQVMTLPETGETFFVGNLTSMEGTSAITAPIGSGLMFFPGALSSVGDVPGLVDAGIRVTATYMLTDSGPSCFTDVL